MASPNKKPPQGRPARIQDIRIQGLGVGLEKTGARALSRLSNVAKDTASAVNRSNIKTIEIKLTLPALPKLPGRAELEKKLRHLPRKYWAIGVAALAAVTALIVGIAVLTSSTPPSAKIPTKSSSIKSHRPQLTRGNPPFATLLPAGKTINELGGWVRISPPNRAPVYTYIDHIDKTQINVSEQPLPSNFKTNPSSSVAQLAQKFNAGDKFEAAGTTIYVATADDGSQSLIVNLKDLLVLITSSDVISNNQWAAYVTALH